MRQLTIEVGLELLVGLDERGCCRLVTPPAPIKGDDAAILLGEGDVADRRVERELGQARFRTIVRQSDELASVTWRYRSAGMGGCQACLIGGELPRGRIFG